MAIVSSGLGHVQRGIESWAKALAENLARDGEDVHLFHGGGSYTCPNTPLKYYRRGDWLTRVITRIAPRFLWRWGLTSSYAFEQRSFALALLPYLKKGAFDVVHTQDVILAGMLEREGRAGRLDCPVILAHGTDEDMSLLKQFRYLQHLSPAHRAKGVIACGGTDCTENYLQNWRATLYRGRSSTDATRRVPPFHFCIPNFVDTGLFRPERGKREEIRAQAGIPEDAFVVGCAAALKASHKRLDVLIQEVAAMRNHPSLLGGEGKGEGYLLLAGATTGETKGLRLLAGTLMKGHCVLLENLPFERMPDFYRALDLFVLPATEEVFGICFLEAMACGVPVLAHYSPTLSWVVGGAGDGSAGARGGWCVDMGKPGWLARVWPQVQSELVEKRASCGEHVRQAFSWPAVRGELLVMYDVVQADWKARRVDDQKGNAFAGTSNAT